MRVLRFFNPRPNRGEQHWEAAERMRRASVFCACLSVFLMVVSISLLLISRAVA